MVTTPNANTDEILIWSDVLDRLACREKKAKKKWLYKEKESPNRIDRSSKLRFFCRAIHWIELQSRWSMEIMSWMPFPTENWRINIQSRWFSWLPSNWISAWNYWCTDENIFVFFQNEISTRSIDSMDQWITYFSCILSYINIQVNNCFHRKRENSIFGRKITSLD